MTKQETTVLDLIHEKVDALNVKVDKVDKILTGNGSPEKGFLFRVALMESKVRRATWVLGTIFTAIISAAALWLFKVL